MGTAEGMLGSGLIGGSLAMAKVMAGEQDSGRVETVHHGRRSQPAADGCVAVQGS